MRIFKYRIFQQWAKKEKISDNDFKKAIEEIGKGLVHAYLGQSLYKHRVAKAGKGKRGGYRIILAFKEKNRSVLMYGFAKKELSNLSNREELVYKKLAQYFLAMPDDKLNLLVSIGELIEVK